jgi:hypothetical protein
LVEQSPAATNINLAAAVTVAVVIVIMIIIVIADGQLRLHGRCDGECPVSRWWQATGGRKRIPARTAPGWVRVG